MTLRALTRPQRPDGSRPKNTVRAKSRAAGGAWERDWMNRLSPGELARHMRVMRIHRDRLYRARRRKGAPPPAPDDPLIPTNNGLRVVGVLVGMAAGGVRLLAISYRELAARAGISVSAVHAQLGRLLAAGMLRWERRCRPTEGPREFGVPQWEQAENVYRLEVPPGIRKAHARAGREADGRREDQALDRAARQRRTAAGDPAFRRDLIRAGLDVSRRVSPLPPGEHESRETPELPGLQA